MANLRANRITSTEVFETTGSVQFDGSGDYLSLAVSSDFQFGSGDFTIECWAYTPNIGTKDILGIYNTGANRRTFALRKDQTESVQFLYSSNGTGGISVDSEDGIINLNQWNHYAVVRKNLEYIIYLNGIRVASQYNADAIYNNTSDGLRIGSSYNTDFEGHISNVRILKGQALYTTNFTPPTRELEVIPNTVLLACQSTTNAAEEKTGKTITVNGNAVANELTPGLLTNVVKSGGSSAITGSVEFDGTGDYLSLADTTDHDFGSNDFTIEGWFYPIDIGGNQYMFAKGNGSLPGTAYDIRLNLNRSITVSFYVFSTAYQFTTISAVDYDSWNHISIIRSGTNFICYVNGINVGSASHGTISISDVSTGFTIGTLPSIGNKFKGFISNLRILKGTALYTQNFIPPTRKLTRLPGTVLLCCQDNNSVTTEATGKTITANGNPTATRFTPSVGSDDSVEFAGPTTINTENYFYLPTGPTEQRGRGRGVFGGGYTSVGVNILDYVNIQSQGNAIDFGDLNNSVDAPSPCSSLTRGLFAGGTTVFSPTANAINNIDYITISSTGNAQDFGDLRESRRFASGGVSNNTRGVWGGGYTPTLTLQMDYVTVASTGTALNFGTTVPNPFFLQGLSSPTRGVWGGGYAGGQTSIIRFITIATTGTISSFGDLTVARHAGTAASSSIRGLFAGGRTGPTLLNTIDYITIASTGNAQDFGDLISARRRVGACSNSTRGLFGGGYNPNFNLIDFVNIASTGDAVDFGDLTSARRTLSGLSDSHGGLQ